MVLPLHDAFLYFGGDGLTDSGFNRWIDVEMTVAQVDGIFNCLCRRSCFVLQRRQEIRNKLKFQQIVDWIWWTGVWMA